MENVKKSRTPVRASFTRTLNELKGEMRAAIPDKQILAKKLAKLQLIATNLKTLDENLLSIMITEGKSDEDYNVEYLAIDSYSTELVDIQVEVKEILTLANPPSRPPAADAAVGEKTYKLPKFEIRKFNGQLIEWLGFWSQFEKIHKDVNLHPSDKFQYLAQAMVAGTRAAELVNSYPQTGDNYAKVIEALQDRFGKKELLQEVYVRELLNLVINSKSKEKIPLAAMFDRLESHLRALESLGVKAEHSTTFLFPMVESSLPEELLVAWQRSSMYNQTEKNRLQGLLDFLKGEVEAEEQRKMARNGFNLIKAENKTKNAKSKPKQEVDDRPTAAGLFGAKTATCLFCDKESHTSQDCLKAQSMFLKGKRDLIQQKRACFICLRIGHQAKFCKSAVKCLVCQKRHHTVICPDLPNHKKESNEEKPAPKEKPNDKELTFNSKSNHCCSSGILLKTLVVKLQSEVGEREVRLVFDDGNQRSYIKRQTAEKAQLVPLGIERMRNSLFGGSVTEFREHKRYKVLLESLDGRNQKEMELLDEKDICGKIPKIPTGPWIEELAENHIKLTDVGSGSTEVEILIGSDYWGSFMTGRILHLRCGMTALETYFGWTLSGPVPEETISNLSISMWSSTANIQDLWCLETIGIMDPAHRQSKQEKEAMVREQFQNTVVQRENGHYAVNLPWISGPIAIPNNFKIAEKRLLTTTKKLKESGNLKAYDSVFNDWLKEDIIEAVDESVKKTCHYLPHRAVFKPTSLSTPVRPVFDASCKWGRSPSLNDCLEKGPNLIELIPAVLTRFRAGRIGVAADIRKAFQMIEVKEEDRDFLRFLWWDNDSQDNIRVFRHKRVVFGVTSSPFLLGAVIGHHLKSFDSSLDQVADKLLHSFYVDNCLTAVNSEEELTSFKRKATDLMARAGMELRQWENSVPGGDEASSVFSMILGLKWNLKKDILLCDIPDPVIPMKITKRWMLSQIQQLFDPMGFICPVLIEAKVKLQKVWLFKLDWDEEIPEEFKVEFLPWLNQMKHLRNFEVPRDITGGIGLHGELQLHIFCDASSLAYATVIILRIKTDEKVITRLVQAKNRLAPAKQMTIPRLELLACVIASRLSTEIVNALKLEDLNKYYWSDSTTALAWIKRNNEWGTFVGNRVKEICTLTNPQDWRHVPGSLNPADLPSRGCSAKQLEKMIWVEGPPWLKLDPNEWPNSMESPAEELVSQEKKKLTQTSCSAVKGAIPWYMKRFSSYQKTVRVFAWIMKFGSPLFRKNRQEGIVSMEEFEAAEKKLLHLVQMEAFPAGVKSVSGLEVSQDEDKLIRVKTKLLQSDEKIGFKWPILLPSSHPIVELIVREEHLGNCHGGVQFLMGNLRERYWIIHSRRTIRRIIQKCIRCRRFSGKRVEVPPVALPQNRTKLGRAFGVVGIDLGGPLLLKDKTKVWFVLFTCAVFRCLHLELVSSLSTEAFLMALQRFVCRRGRPHTIYSDNGSNFLGADNLFRQLDWKRITIETQIKKIKWIFIPPSAPWWGGWWERLIGSVKNLMKRMLGNAKLSYTQLETCFCEVESVINHRPLTYISESSDDLVPLTPSMFLVDVQEYIYPEVDVDLGKKLREKKRQLNVLQEELRSRFRREYLSMLVQQGKKNKIYKFQVGEVVIVEADNQKRWQWPLARITELLPGKDGEFRVARIKLSGSAELLRPLQRLCPLEVCSRKEIETFLDKKITNKCDDKIKSNIQKKSHSMQTRSDDLQKG